MIKAWERRLRPIMITALATVAGMIPPALAFGAGSQMLQPLAIALQGGVLTAGGLVEEGARRGGQIVGGEGVERLGPLAAVAHEAGFAQAAEVGGDPGLGDAGDAHEVGDAQLALAQEGAEPDAAFIAEQIGGLHEAREVHPDISMDE